MLGWPVRCSDVRTVTLLLLCCRRKKDDGRAEAMLIAASGMGLRMAIRRGLDDSSGDTWINATTDDSMDPFVLEELSA